MPAHHGCETLAQTLVEQKDWFNPEGPVILRWNPCPDFKPYECLDRMPAIRFACPGI